MGTQRSIGAKFLSLLIGFILVVSFMIAIFYWMLWSEYSDQRLREYCARIEGGIIIRTEHGLQCSTTKLWNKDK